MNTDSTAAQTLARNLRHLMDKHGLDIPEVSRKSGVSRRMIAYVLQGERVPTLGICEQLADCFGVSCWQLLLPFPIDNDTGHLVAELITAYITASAEGRDFISKTAAREMQLARKN